MTGHPPFSEPFEPESAAQEQITLSLPADIFAAIDRLSRQSGQSQSQVLLNVLRRGLSRQPPLPSTVPAGITLENFQQFVARLTALETLPQRVEELEGKLPAS
jgi:hypothetical protein